MGFRRKLRWLILVLMPLLLFTGCGDLEPDMQDTRTVILNMDFHGKSSSRSSSSVSASELSQYNTHLILALPSWENLTSSYKNFYSSFAQGLMNTADKKVSLEIPLNTQMKIFAFLFKENYSMSELLSGVREVGYYGESRSFSINTNTNSLSLGITLKAASGNEDDSTGGGGGGDQGGTDTTAPVIAEVYPVTTPTSDPSPNYTFSSTKAGTITYGGSCSSGTTSATSGNNTITFLTLSDGTYSDCTIIVTDSDGNASNTLAITSFTVLDCCSSGSAIIQGMVEDNASEALSGVSVIYAKSGTISSTVTTVDNGTYSKSTLSSGTYTLTYTKNGYIATSLSATLTADNETLDVGTVQLLADTCASTGTISGTIKDAVSNSVVTDVSLSVRSGLDTDNGTIVKTATSDSSGNYSLSSMSTGWYTVEASKSGYTTSTFNVFACGDQSGQNGSISTTLSSGSMRIVLSWKSNKDLDGHLTGPDKASGRFHVYYGKKRFHYDINTYSSSRSSSDNVTQDTDSVRGSEGPETITVSAVRSGTYRYYVHNYDNAGQQNHWGLYKSKASVKVYHSSLSGGVTKFKAPNMPGDLWTVFDFDNSSGVTRIRTVGSESSSANVDDH